MSKLRGMLSWRRTLWSSLTIVMVIWCRSSNAQLDGVFDRLFDLYDSANAREMTGYFRIEARLLKLENPDGQLGSGSRCDTLGSCDPVIMHDRALLQRHVLNYSETPTALPGSPDAPDYINYTPVLEIRDENSPTINKLLSRDICGRPFKKIVVRVHVMDHDRLSAEDLLDDFTCHLRMEQDPANNMELANWSPQMYCLPKSGHDKLKLSWKYRFFRIDPQDCRTMLSATIV